MDWQDWASVLLSGSLAALVGLGGAVTVFVLTKRADQREVASARTAQSVAQVATQAMAAARALAAARWRRTDAAIFGLTEAVVSFNGTEYRDHPEVCRWLVTRLDATNAAFAELEAGRWRPGHRARAVAILEPLAEFASRLSMWNQGTVRLSWFIEHTPPRNGDASTPWEHESGLPRVPGQSKQGGGLGLRLLAPWWGRAVLSLLAIVFGLEVADISGMTTALVAVSVALALPASFRLPVKALRALRLAAGAMVAVAGALLVLQLGFMVDSPGSSAGASIGLALAVAVLLSAVGTWCADLQLAAHSDAAETRRDERSAERHQELLGLLAE